MILWHHPFSCRNFSGTYAEQLGDGDIFILTNREQEMMNKVLMCFSTIDRCWKSTLPQEQSKTRFQRIKVTQFLLGKDDLYGSYLFLCQPNNQIWLSFFLWKTSQKGFYPYQLMVSRLCGRRNQDFDR